jgi:hypothetical protein
MAGRPLFDHKLRLRNPSATATPDDNPGIGDPAKWLGIREYSGSATTLTSLGYGAGGTAGVPAAAPGATDTYVSYTTTTALGSTAGWNGANGEIQTGFEPDTTFVLRTGPVAADIAGIRLWVGFASAAPTAADDPAGLHIFAFRYSTGAGDTNWQATTKDGTTLGITNTGVAVAANTRYVMRIDARNPASILFYIAGVLVATRTTNLPSSSTGTQHYIIATNTTAGTARTIKIRKVHTVASF